MIHNIISWTMSPMVNEPGSPSKWSSRPSAPDLSRQGCQWQKVKRESDGTSGRIFPLKCDHPLVIN